MKISVVIPSRRREGMLRECLKSLRCQKERPSEVVVVENDTAQSYQKIRKDFKDLPLNLLLQKEVGKSKARNMGLKRSKGEVVAFLDDDCEPVKDWLKNIKEAFLKSGAEVILGESLEKKKSLLMEAYVFQYNEFFLAKRIDFKTGEVKFGEALNSRNFAIKRSFFEKNNIYFDTRYDCFGFAEDTDFGEQISRAGGKIFYEKSAKVFHKDEEFLIPLLKKKFRNGRAMVLLKKKGFFNELKIERRKRFVFERSIKLIKGHSAGEVVALLLYLNLIIMSYRLGIFYERFFGKGKN